VGSTRAKNAIPGPASLAQRMSIINLKLTILGKVGFRVVACWLGVAVFGRAEESRFEET
jgi:hypothetical protein